MSILAAQSVTLCRKSNATGSNATGSNTAGSDATDNNAAGSNVAGSLPPSRMEENKPKNPKEEATLDNT